MTQIAKIQNRIEEEIERSENAFNIAKNKKHKQVKLEELYLIGRGAGLNDLQQWIKDNIKE